MVDFSPYFTVIDVMAHSSDRASQLQGRSRITTTQGHLVTSTIWLAFHENRRWVVTIPQPRWVGLKRRVATFYRRPSLAGKAGDVNLTASRTLPPGLDQPAN
jgi:hypothetical protein